MHKAVIFDVGCNAINYSVKPLIIRRQIGGVVMRSPFISIAEYERKLGLPVNYINCSMWVLRAPKLTLLFLN